MTRRMLFRRGGTAALGAAVVWSAPSIRTIAMRADAAGTPPPARRNREATEVGNDQRRPGGGRTRRPRAARCHSPARIRARCSSPAAPRSRRAARSSLGRQGTGARARRGLSCSATAGRLTSRRGARRCVDERDHVAHGSHRQRSYRCSVRDAARRCRRRAVAVAAQPHEGRGRVQVVQASATRCRSTTISSSSSDRRKSVARPRHGASRHQGGSSGHHAISIGSTTRVAPVRDEVDDAIRVRELEPIARTRAARSAPGRRARPRRAP